MAVNASRTLPVLQNGTVADPLCSNFIWTQQHDKTHLNIWSEVVAGLSILGCLFNILVVMRIISKVQHPSQDCKGFSKIYYLSLAIADFLVATCSVGYTFVFHDIVSIKRGSRVWYVAVGTTWISVMSSLLHVVAITADRFIATKFPLYYYKERHHKRRKVTIGIGSIWIASIVLVASMKFMYQLAFWCAAVCIPMASLGIVVTYSHLMVVSIKQRIARRTGQPVQDITDASVRPGDIKKSMNTLLLGLFVTFTYVVCNLPLSVAVIKYLRDKTCPSMGGKIAIQALLTINTVMDPLLYALFDIVKSIRKNITEKLTHEIPKLFTLEREEDEPPLTIMS